jgi:diguanylate cyclase (GGDEF)-like protein/PAS domain S-box-containing protein
MTSLPPGFDDPAAFLAALEEHVGGIISYVDGQERVQFASRPLLEYFGRPREQVIGRTLRELHGEENYARFGHFMRQGLAGEEVHYERESTDAAGRKAWISVAVQPHRDAAGKVLGIFTTSLEVRELKRTHDALGHALEEVAAHIENTPLAVVEWDAELRIKRWSPQAEGIFGWKAGEVRGKSSLDIGFVHRDSAEIVKSLTGELLQGRARRNRMLSRNVTRDGRAIWCEWYNSAFFDGDGRLASILSFAEDVTARVESEEQLKQAAVHDALTGLPNRNSLASRLEHAIVRVNRSGDRIALLFIDLDRFKKVNDTLGHAAGDEVLRQAAARIRACVREVDTVARLGGDEFVVLLEADVRPDTPGIIGERVRGAFSTPFDYKGAEVHCGASVGVSLYPDHARDPAALLASADEAMYRVKHAS